MLLSSTILAVQIQESIYSTVLVYAIDKSFKFHHEFLNNDNPNALHALENNEMVCKARVYHKFIIK